MLTIYDIIIPISILLITIGFAFIIDRSFKFQIKRISEDLNNDPTNYKFLRRAIVVLIYIVGCSIAIYSVAQLRVLAQSLLAGAGVLAVAVGFASQQALGNIISGIFIIIFKPFRINDRLQIGTNSGIVEDITLRHTVIRNFENRRIIIPNSNMGNEVIINADFGDDKICKWIDIGISYDSDIKLAKAIIKDEILKHPLNIDPRTPEQIELQEEQVPVRVITLADSSVNLRGWSWAQNSADAFSLGCDLLESIKLRFDKEGIEIPFPHRTLFHKNIIETDLNKDT
ncbi:mechanosensitive ion channel family protein [uncultured Dokdonia sp.]|uniref:mechanosensitive ion channel family protein n=1 Tax=uncultured Dokdonia sp. TaxID=575653 RepID=UPI002608C7D1|nr:mechanosensitive ion channel family protein [uncultured Dokdonia sp.]